jgi:DNA-binding NarL/FixJ family response regulator
MSKIRVLLADDHTVVRQGLKALLTAENDIEVIAEAENGQQAVDLARKMAPDVVIMDLAMPIMNGLASTKQILKSNRLARIIVLSSYSDDECVREMMEAGALGFLMKESASVELAQAVRNVRRGSRVLSAELARRARSVQNGHFLESGNGRKTNDLTAREVEVLKIIGEGYTNKEIAGLMGISIKTVEKHRQQVMNKLNIHEVAGLTRYALSRNLIPRTVPAAAA